MKLTSRTLVIGLVLGAGVLQAQSATSVLFVGNSFTHGYYLEALVVFGSLTGRDPRSLGENECSAYELGLPRSEVKALQRARFC